MTHHEREKLKTEKLSKQPPITLEQLKENDQKIEKEIKKLGVKIIRRKS